MPPDRTPRFLALAASFVAILLVFFLLVRPWYLRWGATDEELLRPLPGDEIVAGPAAQETRAIAIHAPVEAVWPWLAQLGQDRGGFYSFDLVENLVGCEMPTEDRLRPARQAWRLGDKLWMYPPHKAHGAGFATLRTYIPGRALGFATRVVGTPLSEPENGSWSFFLEPGSGRTTRLLVRGRGATTDRSLLGAAFDRSIFEPIHFVMERRMLIGLKQLAEGSNRQRLLNHVQVVLWTFTFGLFLASIVLLIRRKNWLRPLVAFIAAAGVFQILTLAQPPVVLGIVLVAAVALVLCWPASRSHNLRW